MKPAAAWLVCYDIAEPRRLARVWRAVREFGVPLQYSVFWARLDNIGLGEALAAIATRIEPHADDVRLYPLPENVQITGLGRDVVPLGVDLGDPVLRRFRRWGGPSFSNLLFLYASAGASGRTGTQLPRVHRCLTSVSGSA